MKFTFQELASAGTAYLFGTETDNGIGGVYKVLNFMLDANLFTHQLPRAYDVCYPEIVKQHPWVAELKADLDDLTRGQRAELCSDYSRLIEIYGNEFEVERA